jgi:hypothetical protein
VRGSDSEWRRAEPTLDANPRQRLDRLQNFRDGFELMVSVLVEAINYGPTPKLENDYAALGVVLRQEYEMVRPFVLAYLRVDSVDEGFGIRVRGKGSDAFECLWVAASLQDFLNVVDRSFDARITRSREALALYGDHLRYLVDHGA